MLSLRLSDPTGREVLHQMQEIGAGASVVDLPVETLPSGLYFLWVQNAAGTGRMEKVLKQ
jgi:hypothetical protein